MSENKITQGLLEEIFAASSDSIILIKAIRDKNYKIVDFVWLMFNQRASQMYHSPNGVMEVGKRVSESIPGALFSENFKRWVYTADTGEAYQVEYFYELEGFNSWFRERGIRCEDGVIVTSEDITEQKTKEEKLQRSEAFLLESQNIAQLGAFQWNEDMSEGFWTPQLFKIYGVEPYSIKVTPGFIASVIHPEDKERFFGAVNKAKIAQEPYSMEYRAITADGSIKYLWARGKMVNGKLTGTVMDITERKLNEEKLQRSEELLLESQQIAQIGTFQMNERGEIYWTQQMYKIFEIDPSVKITVALIDGMVHPADLSKFLDSTARVMRSGESHTIEYRLVMPDGRLKYIWSRAKVTNGKFTGTAMDITERKELELNNTKLEHRNADLDSFVHTASHDLRSPVNNISTLLSFLDNEMPDKNESVGLYLSLLNKSIVDLRNTLHDLTSVTEIHPGEQKQLVDLHEVIEDVKVSLYKQIEDANATITVNLSIPFLAIPKKHARSLVYNLLSNALKFNAKDRKLLVAISSGLNNNRIHLSFQDNGIGIKEADQPKVFMIFKRFNREIAGMGIGMYLVKRIIDLNNGDIYLQSQENVGTTFHIQFPIVT